MTSVNTNYQKPDEVNCGKLIYTMVRKDNNKPPIQPILEFTASENFGNSTVNLITESKE